MNERYRYGYGDEPADRDSAFSRHGSMTEPRDERAAEEPAAGASASHGDADDEERRADEIREAAVTEPADPVTGTAATTGAAPADEAAELDQASTTASDDTDSPSDEAERSGAGGGAASAATTSVFDVDDEPDAGVIGRDDEERPPIALGPPERDRDEAAATTTAPSDEADDLDTTSVRDLETADTAKPDAASPLDGTPTTESPAAVPTGVDGLEPEPDGQGSTGTETEMLMPGTGPAPVTAPVDDRSALLGSLDADATRARFLDIQAGFVDEPRQAVQEAERFVDDLVQSLVTALEAERSKLKETIEDGSTEDLRLALRGYRAFVDRLLNLTL
jgi:hypothetical protein